MKKKLIITGIRGIPGEHGGFESFAEKLALFLSHNNWEVIVYCQKKGLQKNKTIVWNGINCRYIYMKKDNSLSTIFFDFKTIIDSLKYKKYLILTLGYNTALFNILYFFLLRKNIINMDGIEWKRERWSLPVKLWFYFNEKIAKLFSTHMVADHPEIKKHLNTFNLFNNKITIIPYGANALSIKSKTFILQKLNLSKNKYAILIARPVPENSILQVVRAFSLKKRDIKLLILGSYSKTNHYHKLVLNEANSNVVFAGAIYDQEMLSDLRSNALFYIHGHTVGGTNPALVEGLGAGQAIIAHDNKFNRHVAKSAAVYFYDEKSLDNIFDNLINNKILIKKLRTNAKSEFIKNYQWDYILDKYEKLLLRYV